MNVYRLTLDDPRERVINPITIVADSITGAEAFYDGELRPEHRDRAAHTIEQVMDNVWVAEPDE